jgi:hypothetical protein
MAPELFVYRLPSGKEIVGSLQDYNADTKAEVLVYRIVSPVPENSVFSDAQPIISRLPSGQGVVQTFKEAGMDCGTVVGKIIGWIL